MKYSIKQISKILLILLIVDSLILISCGKTTENADTANTTAIVEETEPETRYIYHDNLPDTLDASGKTLRFLTENMSPFHTFMTNDEEFEGDLVNEAINGVNLVLEERFDIKMEETRAEYGAGTSTAKQTILAGDDAFDLIALIDRDVVAMAAEDMVIPTDTLEYVDLSKPYWNQLLNESLKFGDRNYVAYSDAMLTTYDFTYILLFNKEMVLDNDLKDPYALVEDGTWTFEEFKVMGTTVTSDVNGDGEMNDNDRYGWLAVPKQLAPCTWIACGTQTITKDSSNLPVFNMGSDERMLNALQLAYDLSWGDTFWYHTSQIHGTDIIDPDIFGRGDALFTTSSFVNMFTEYYREIEFDYGIIPYPKMDVSQEDYYTRVEGGCPMFVPTTASDTEFAGAMMEALACAYKNDVLPVYYDTGLKNKYSRDEVSAKMIDLIMENRIYDLGDTLFNPYIRDGFVANAFNNKKTVAASDIKANTNSVTNAIEKIISGLMEE